MDEYISRKEAIEKLYEVYEQEYPTASGDFDEYASHDVPNVLRNIKTADVQPIDRWISVKDRLPDESCECLGIVDGEVTEVSYSPKCKELICVWSMCDADGSKPLPDDAVTHWMPMPKPPKDGDTNG